MRVFALVILVLCLPAKSSQDLLVIKGLICLRFAFCMRLHACAHATTTHAPHAHLCAHAQPGETLAKALKRLGGSGQQRAMGKRWVHRTSLCKLAAERNSETLATSEGLSFTQQMGSKVLENAEKRAIKTVREALRKFYHC